MIEPADVVIVGGGPAGSATGGAIAGGGRKVVVFERGHYDTPRVGETLGAEIAPLLIELGAAAQFVPFLNTQTSFTLIRSVFGSLEPQERSSIVHPLGSGWHVDRVLFDKTLAAWAVSMGASVRTGVGRCVVSKQSAGYLVSPEQGEPVLGRFLVDATGRGAHVVTSLGVARWLSFDRQVAIVGLFRTADPVPVVGAELLLEAVEEGFWYSAPQPDGSLIVVMVTDSDLLVTFGKNKTARFETALRKTEQTKDRVSNIPMVEPPRVYRSDSGLAFPTAGPDWCTIGDAAMGTDPLGGNGVARALRGAIELNKGLDNPQEKPDYLSRFGNYLDQRAAYYGMETRWPDAPFWARRRMVDETQTPIDWRMVPLTLLPPSKWGWAGEPPPHVEAWLSSDAIQMIHRELKKHGTAYAYELLSTIQETMPLEHRRLLVGLQNLVEKRVLIERVSENR
ncbi:MAG: tryptophan 7-halogenase [Myxococcales bacterium]|nr:tryptophan 7-halogenase [Myxococcales bacterium]